ncbi:MAG: hypothetical protein JXO22_17660 [Phycisphaerae bacterium]|nr:hypothetical protein [Phycisphaerae bacterium]
MDDWRLQGQEEYLKGITLRRATYRPYREGWDHDHCEFCGCKFSTRPGDQNEGYTTLDEYRWICQTCYEDFKAVFAWTIVSEPGT